MDKVPVKKNFGSAAKTSSAQSVRRRLSLSADTKILLGQIGIGVGVFAIIGLLLWGIFHLTRLPALTITTITASGGETIDADEVEALAASKLEGAYGKLIPRRFFLFYSQSAIIEAVEGVDRIRDVVVERASLTELSITYGEHEPFALWCDRTPADTCLFLNDRGYAFAPAPPLRGGNFIRFFATSTPEKGVTLLPPEDFWNIIALSELLTQQRLFVTAVEIDAVGDVYYQLTAGGELRTSLQDPAEQVADNLRTILTAETFAPLADGDFHYIDLRFGNKVYVSEEDIALTIASSTATTTESVVVGTSSSATSTTSE